MTTIASGSSRSRQAGSPYSCSYAGCGRLFGRRDHLLRHAANHEKSTHHCRTCKRGFKRRDLLNRHERRGTCSQKQDNSDHTSPGTEDELPHLSPAQSSHSRQSNITLTENAVASGSFSFLSTSPLIATSSTSVAHQQPSTDIRRSQNGNDANNGQTSHFTQTLVLDTSSSNQQTDNIFNLEESAQSAGIDWSLSPSWNSTNWQTDPWPSFLQEIFGQTSNEIDNSMPAVDMGMTQPYPIQDISSQMPMPVAEIPPPPTVSVEALLPLVNEAVPELSFTVTSLTDALSDYWSKVAPTFPFIHHGTFYLEPAPPYLVAMMAIVGSRAANPAESSQSPDTSKIVRSIRCELFKQCGLDMPIATLQALCLCHVHDTWYGTSESQFVAQCMWSTMVAYTRKKGAGVAGSAKNEGHEEAAWVAWAKDEERRRSAASVLLCDTQFTAFWNQHCSRQLSIFAHNSALPCPRAQWEAKSASEWARLRESTSLLPPVTTRKSRKAHHLPGLHPEFQVSSVSEGYAASILSALTPDSLLTFRVDLDGYLGVEMVLMGLMAIAWDFRTRGGMGIDFKVSTKQWRSVVLKAIINLRAVWENNTSHMPPTIPTRDLRDTLAISIISVLSDIPMLQVAAGVKFVCGASIGEREYKDAQRRLKSWAQSDDAWTCLWNCARYIRQAIFTEWGIYTSWAVYLSSLVHWAYAWSLLEEDEEISPPSYNPKSRTTQLLDSILSATSTPKTLDDGVGDLLMCAAEKMVNTPLDREAADVLWRLLGPDYMRKPVI